MEYLLIVFIVLLVWAVYELYVCGVEYNKKVENLYSQIAEQNKALLDIIETIKADPKFNKHWKYGIKISLLVSFIINDYQTDIKEKVRKINTKNSVIARRNKRITNLLNKKTKGTK